MNTAHIINVTHGNDALDLGGSGHVAWIIVTTGARVVTDLVHGGHEPERLTVIADADLSREPLF
jgi:hypothetical protein